LRGETYRDLAQVLVAAGDIPAARAAFEQAIANFAQKGIMFEAERTRGRLAEIQEAG
jgi:hypothetical protein